MLTFDDLKEGKIYITKSPTRKKDFTPQKITILKKDDQHIEYKFVPFDGQGHTHTKTKTLTREAFEQVQKNGVQAEQLPTAFYKSKIDFSVGCMNYQHEKTKRDKRKEQEKIWALEKKKQEQEPVQNIETITVHCCPYCNSKRIVNYTLRSDNFYGDTHAINDESFYNTGDLTEKDDLDILICRSCNRSIPSIDQTRDVTVEIEVE